MAGKALITGGAGFIGSHLCELLLDDGGEVFALDDLSTGSLENIAHLRDAPGFHLVVDSVLSPAVVNELVHKCDVVYHLAAAVGVTTDRRAAGADTRHESRGHGDRARRTAPFGKRVLVASTLRGLRRPSEEAAARDARRRLRRRRRNAAGLYADSKAMDEFLALAYQQERGLDCVIARLFNTVGPAPDAASTAW